jgi:hypothetical protein
MALTKLTTDLIEGNLGGGTTWVSDPKTASFTAVAGEGYFVNTTSAAITVTLPSSPSAGDEVSIIDYGANASTNNITITSSDNIEGAAADLVLSTDKVSKTLVYSDATKGWLVTTEAEAEPTVTVDYLVVAGAGGSESVGGNGWGNGGGGAGGLRTSYGSVSGGGVSAETALTLLPNESYTVTIGAGGINTGNNSVFDNITSDAGGGGGINASANFVNGRDGGSGGGAAGNGGNPGSATPGQGYDGGAGAGSADIYNSGGGGGAGGVGGGGTASAAGNGGNGLPVNIINTTNAAQASIGEVSGSDVYFASGGGGAPYTDTVGTSPVGGGGDGVTYGQGNPNNGAANTGGGGGGVSNKASLDSYGGSGVVILRYTDAYTITVGAGISEATGSPFTEGTDKVSVFTAGTGTITFGAA